MNIYNKNCAIPAKAGIQSVIDWRTLHDVWISAFAVSNRIERFKQTLPGRPQGEELALGVMTRKWDSSDQSS